MDKSIKEAAEKAAKGAGRPFFIDGVPERLLESYRNDVAGCAAHGVLMELLRLSETDPDFEKVRQKIIYLATAPSVDRIKLRGAL